MLKKRYRGSWSSAYAAATDIPIAANAATHVLRMNFSPGFPGILVAGSTAIKRVLRFRLS
jgi:hypothetical protein